MLLALRSLWEIISPGTGDLDFTVVEIVRDYRLEGAAIIIDGNLAGFTRSIGVFRQNGVAAGSHSLQISLNGYNGLTGTFNVAAGVTTTAEFRLVPFINQFLLKGPERSQPYSRNIDTWGSSRLRKPEDRGCRH